LSWLPADAAVRGAVQATMKVWPVCDDERGTKANDS
jgi:hypothetical protein